MRKISFRISVAIILLAIFSSCEKVIEFDIPEAEPQLTVNGYTSLTDSVTIYMGASLSYLDGGEPAFITGADVNLYKDGALLGEIEETFSDLGVYTYPSFLTSPGAYEVRASASGYDDVSVTSIIPQHLSNVVISEGELVSEEENEYKFTLEFSDPADQKDYYHFIVTQDFPEFGSSPSASEFSTNSEVFIAEEQGFDFEGEYFFYTRALFSDALIDGSSTSLEFKVRIFDQPGQEFNVHFIKCSEEYYLYHKSLFAAENADGFFVQPVQVFTNVSGGLGAVTGYNNMILPLNY